MNKSVPPWQIAGFLFTSVAGTLLHFLFDWTGGNVAAALFSAVNESIWEHMKLLFYPMVLFTLAEFKAWGSGTSCFWQIKLLGIVTGLSLIPVLFYTYSGILGLTADWFNITIFFIAAAVAYRLETALFQKGFRCRLSSAGAVAILVLISLLFSILTFFPPRIPFFEDPITGTYGFR